MQSAAVSLVPFANGRQAVSLPRLTAARAAPLPRCLAIVLDNLARQALCGAGTDEQMRQIAAWTPGTPEVSVALSVGRVILPDSSGLPVLMDLAAARDAMVRAGGDPALVEPTADLELVVDHSLIVDVAGRADAADRNLAAEYRRNRERYAFFKWAEGAFGRLRVVPPGQGIIHQVHLERLARMIEHTDTPGGPVVGPEFVLGCDSHTPMINGLGVLGWGVGGIDGEAAALGQPHMANIGRVVGVRLDGRLPPGAMPTDLVLRITEKLRKLGVVGDFVEFFGPGLSHLTVPDRATIANMAPEYGATTGYFPIDAQTIAYLRQSGRDPAHVALVEAHARAAGLFVDDHATAPAPDYSEVMALSLDEIVPCIAGPRRPQDRIALTQARDSFRDALTRPVDQGGFGLTAAEAEKRAPLPGLTAALRHGAITIAAITSCTNTSNPTTMLAAGLLARNAVSAGLKVPAWVKTSLAPGSRLVSDYLSEAGLMAPLEALGFHVVGYGCTTCSGKSGPIAPEIAEAVRETGLVAAAVLSGNRNFEGRIHPSARAAYLASPPLVVAFALAGRVDVDFGTEPLGQDRDGHAVFLADIWPDAGDIQALVATSQRPERYRESYAGLFDGAGMWDALEAPGGIRFAWDERSTYIRRPQFFDLPDGPLPDRIDGARVLVLAGDLLTTDHITPSGEIPADSAAGRYLIDCGVAPRDFNAVTQRRGNDAFMARVTFANPRFRNLLVPERPGGWTRTAPEAEPQGIHDTATAWQQAGVPAMVLAGRDYGMGSSRDWAAKGPKLLGVRLVLAQSFERIHRANLIGMGILPLRFAEGDSAGSLGLSGFESFCFTGLRAAVSDGRPVQVVARGAAGPVAFEVHADLRSAHERRLMQDGGLFAALMATLLRKDRQDGG